MKGRDKNGQFAPKFGSKNCKNLPKQYFLPFFGKQEYWPDTKIDRKQAFDPSSLFLDQKAAQ